MKPKFLNKDPKAPWNQNPDDVFEPWNSLIYFDDFDTPWNDVLCTNPEEELAAWKAKHEWKQ